MIPMESFSRSMANEKGHLFQLFCDACPPKVALRSINHECANRRWWHGLSKRGGCVEAKLYRSVHLCAAKWALALRGVGRATEVQTSTRVPDHSLGQPWQNVESADHAVSCVERKRPAGQISIGLPDVARRASRAGVDHLGGSEQSKTPVLQ